MSNYYFMLVPRQRFVCELLYGIDFFAISNLTFG